MSLSFPAASYIAGMDLLGKQKLGTAATVLSVLAFNVIMLMLRTPADRLRDEA